MDFSLSVFIAQLINFLILFFGFKRLLWDKYSDLITYRKWLDKKYADVESDIAQMMATAESQKQWLINEWVAHKNKLVTEAEAVAKKREETILDAANKKASQIEDAASHQAQQMKASIESEFEKTVKDATKIVVTKLVEKTPEIKDEYINTLVKEFSAAK